MSPTAPVFLTGCPRSGTTWLLDIFKEHPGALTTAESAILDCLRTPWWDVHQAPGPARQGGKKSPSLAQRLAGATDSVLDKLLVRAPAPWFSAWRPVLERYWHRRRTFILQHAGLRRSWTPFGQLRWRLVPYPQLLQLIDRVEQQAAVAGDDEGPTDQNIARLLGHIFDAYRERHDSSSEQVLVEKTPSHLFHGRFLLQHFPEARLVEIRRDGRDVCVSMEAYSQWMPRRRRFQIWEWSEYLREGLAIETDPVLAPRHLVLRYEELKADPATHIHRLLHFAHLPSTPAQAQKIADAVAIEKKQNRGEGQHYRKGQVGDWRERMSAEDQETFKEMAGDVLERAGYGW
ncbi:MAG: sulfotransferase [Acidobacteriota bacterium]